MHPDLNGWFAAGACRIRTLASRLYEQERSAVAAESPLEIYDEAARVTTPHSLIVTGGAGSRKVPARSLFDAGQRDARSHVVKGFLLYRAEVAERVAFYWLAAVIVAFPWVK